MRPSIDHTLMAIATVWEGRSTCSRNHVGVVIAKDGRLIGSGYNGAPAGMPHCEHEVITFNHSPETAVPVAWPFGAHPLKDKGCRIAVHAEANAIAYCARDGISVNGATLYTTLSPCYACAQLIVSSGIVRVAYRAAYRDMAGTQLLISAGLVVEKWA